MRTLVLHGGPIRTMDPARPAAAALVIHGDRIEAVLDDAADAPAGAERVDLQGRTVLPGFTDAHVHFPTWALARRELDLVHARSLAEAVDRVARPRRRAAGCAGAAGATSCGPPATRPAAPCSTR